MSITIKKNLKPTFEVIGMLCDKPLSKDLNKYELTRFLNCHSTNLLIGKPGSGKTTLMLSLFNKLLRGCFHNIYLFQPSHSRASMKKDIFEELPDEQKFDELNHENL
jgi:DNA replication protein DnaC